MSNMSIVEFRKSGLLQEINRQFLHPMGLALSVFVDKDKEVFGPILDFRDDPEGLSFQKKLLSKSKANKVKKMFNKKKSVRIKKLGWHIQPLS